MTNEQRGGIALCIASSLQFAKDNKMPESIKSCTELAAELSEDEVDDAILLAITQAEELLVPGCADDSDLEHATEEWRHLDRAWLSFAIWRNPEELDKANPVNILRKTLWDWVSLLNVVYPDSHVAREFTRLVEATGQSAYEDCVQKGYL